jgi:hypothetical protein
MGSSVPNEQVVSHGADGVIGWRTDQAAHAAATETDGPPPRR